MKIIEILEQDRPRERLIKLGVSDLTDTEILSIIIRVGTKKHSAKELANNILLEYSLEELRDLNYIELCKIKGIKKSKACAILASFELARRSYQLKESNLTFINSKSVFDYFQSIYINDKLEKLYCILLDIKCKLIKVELMQIGDVNNVYFDIKRIIKFALRYNSFGIIVVHNHPSGDPRPSRNDVISTNDLLYSCKIIGIKLIDHIIIGRNSWYSFSEKDKIE